MRNDFSKALFLFQSGKLDEAKNICEEILKQENIDYINLDQMFLDPKDYAKYFPILTPTFPFVPIL